MPDEFPEYEILSEIGRGGMGIVYKARHKQSDRLVAIKQLVLDNVDPKKIAEFKDRFRREAQTALRLEHANIVKVFEISPDPDRYYYVMEHLEGNNLREELAKFNGVCPLATYWNILKQLGEGLSYAHSMNVVHRDVKPDNIFILNDGTVKITDFGIARVADLEGSNLTKTGVMLGTLSYVSPEQLENAKTVDHRADIFSLGVVSYEALCGQLPFTGDGIAGTIVKIMSNEETPLHSLNKKIPVEVSSTVSRSLRKKPRDRYRSVRDFLREFEQSLEAHSSEISGLFDMVANQTIVDGCKPIDFLHEANELTNQSKTQIEMPQTDLADKTMASVRLLPQRDEKGTTQNVGISLSLDKEGLLKNKRPKTPQANQTPVLMDNPARQEKRGPGQAKPPQLSGTTYNPIRYSFTITGHGQKNQQFGEPAVVCYRSGRLLVADSATRYIHMFSRDGRWLCDLTYRPEIDTKTSGGRLTKPSGIALDERGRIYLSDSSDHFIRMFDSQGIFLKEFKNIKGREGGLQGIVVDSAGLLYVSDSSNGCLQLFQSDVGVWMRSIAVGADGQGVLKLPSGLACDKLNRIYVVDYGTCMVSIFNKAGAMIRSFGSKGTQ
ncbi:MAG: protein kinase, partial [Cyanobacteria bacterium]|nr:protein kinase [Cyanobacteriota bacterium]